MDETKKHINPFAFLKKDVQNAGINPTRIKPDGTKVIEEATPIGKTVYEIKPDGTLISLSYDKNDRLFCDYARRTNLEIGHAYDELGKMIYEFNSLYDEKNVLAKKTEIEYEYYDEGEKFKETILITPGDKITEISFDRSGKQTEKVETRGTVKTWFDENDKPVKRQIDRGSGGIITEDLS